MDWSDFLDYFRAFTEMVVCTARCKLRIRLSPVCWVYRCSVECPRADGPLTIVISETLRLRINIDAPWDHET